VRLLLLLLCVLAISPLHTYAEVAVVSPKVDVPAASVKVQKYVRNVTQANGKGESLMIGEHAFYVKGADVVAQEGDVVEYAIVFKGGDKNSVDVKITEALPPYSQYVPGSSKLNQVQLADRDNQSIIFSGFLVNDASSKKGSGSIKAKKEAIISYQVKVTLNQ